ncbi:MAG: isocitrate/isopropylmalate family dehydrogenase [Desulfosudis oleivorans]|nr:isocitrate/isopropylmalate family dehydrogenase [Desulfosudis oleivorans]
MKQFNAIYLGAIGHPDVKPGVPEKGILLKLRFELDQYINLRPVKLYPGRGDPARRTRGPRTSTSSWCARTPRASTPARAACMMKGTPDEVAVQEHRSTPARAWSAASATPSRLPRKRNKRKKLDPLRQDQRAHLSPSTCGSGRSTRSGEGLSRHQARVLRTSTPPRMWMVKNPEWFDVIVTDNMFGDIITDLGAMVQGGMGIALRRQYQSAKAYRCSNRLAAAHRNIPA